MNQKLASGVRFNPENQKIAASYFNFGKDWANCGARFLFDANLALANRRLARIHIDHHREERALKTARAKFIGAKDAFERSIHNYGEALKLEGISERFENRIKRYKDGLQKSDYRHVEKQLSKLPHSP